MAGKNIFKGLLHPKAQVGRNGFDLSHRKVFSAKAGELLPILCEDVVPGDYFEIDTATLVRTMPLNTAAFLRAKCCFDFFFVPKTKLWSQYMSFIGQRDTRDSSTAKSYLYEPNITLADLNTAVLAGSTTSPVNSDEAKMKLLQLLGYGAGMKQLPQGLDSSKSLTCLPILGYNSIYDYHYRNAWRDDPFTTGSLEINMVNADFLGCDTYANSLYPSALASSFVQMHYHGWFKDLFMGSLPNSQFGVVSSVLVNASENNLYLQTSNGSNITSGNLNINPTGSNYGIVRDNNNVNLQFANDFGKFDVLALRKALALQKWKEYNMRAGWKSRYQQSAQFGVDAPRDAYHDIDFIDSYEQSISIDEVISTANTSSPSSGNGNLAEIAGKGISAGGSKKIKYNVNVPGYIYCIFYVMPQAEYDALGIDRQLVRSEPFDHYTPAFENLGMQAIHKNELNMGGNSSVFNDVLGYAPNYYEYKTRTDKVYGPFMTSGGLSPWVSVRRDLQNIINSGNIPTSYFYVNPSVLDSIFVANADHTLDSDQFLVNCNFGISAVRPMSVLGLPTI